MVSTVGHFLAPSSSDTVPSSLGQELNGTKLDRVVAQYLPILVGATLHHSPVLFADDVGTVQRFDATIHAAFIDGDAVKIGQACFVVFPALVEERQGGQGLQLLSKSYVLPIVKC